ncbi:MAG: hypothetical protein LBT53_08920, partial [Puniceicoccales bacterium]|nr:hypothetical protein [Puniceicoccales bacterium]
MKTSSRFSRFARFTRAGALLTLASAALTALPNNAHAAGIGRTVFPANGTALDTNFVAPPNDTRVGCYWYWTHDGIRKEGIIADLEAMKKAGITRAFIGLVGGGNDPVLFSPQWWELVHTALKTATRLDIEIGLFNCPGWSQSGGPWIKPSQSMRYLTAVSDRTTGP